MKLSLEKKVLCGLGLATAVIAVSGLIAILSALRRWQSAWSNAMFVQMVVLIAGLVHYFNERPWYTFVMLVYAVFAVTYLMLPGVQAAFLPPGDRRDD